MPKAKKTDSEKIAKFKGEKSVKADKAAKEKKGRKKDKAVETPKAKGAAKKPAHAKPKKAAAPEVRVPTEAISLRAYFIAERRQAMGWPGDAAHDWIEAEKQLKAEALRKAKRSQG
ncbi:MAG: DUF2934 domain-containing protein [Terrimicrobiaceae bacterium]|nr:DUF2934 domain-containing protein [Terrimicrobiaceae bacterium]